MKPSMAEDFNDLLSYIEKHKLSEQDVMNAVRQVYGEGLEKAAQKGKV